MFFPNLTTNVYDPRAAKEPQGHDRTSVKGWRGLQEHQLHAKCVYLELDEKTVNGPQSEDPCRM